MWLTNAPTLDAQITSADSPLTAVGGGFVCGVLGSTRMEVPCSLSPAEVHSEDDQGGEMECEEDRQNWQSLVSPGVLASLSPQEIKRQEVINGDHVFNVTQGMRNTPVC